MTDKALLKKGYFLHQSAMEAFLHPKLIAWLLTWMAMYGLQVPKGPAISLRDSLIPRRSFVMRLVDIAQKAGIPFQLEVESAGGSDAKELQRAHAPWDWCFVGAPEDHVHSPDEIVYKKDIVNMVALFKVLMESL